MRIGSSSCAKMKHLLEVILSLLIFVMKVKNKPKNSKSYLTNVPLIGRN